MKLLANLKARSGLDAQEVGRLSLMVTPIATGLQQPILARGKARRNMGQGEEHQEGIEPMGTGAECLPSEIPN